MKQFVIFVVNAMIIIASCLFGEHSPVLLIAGIVTSGAVFTVSSYKDSPAKTVALIAVAVITSAATSFYHGFDTFALCKFAETLLLICAPGVVMGFSAKRKCSLISVLVGGALCYLAPLIMWFVYFKFSQGINIAEEFISKPVAEFIEVYKQTLAASNLEGAHKALQLADDIRWLLEQTVTMIIPSVMIVASAFAAYVVFSSGRVCLAKFSKTDLEQYPKFHELQAPRSASIVLAILFIASLFMESSPLSGAVINIVIILCAVFFLCGLSVIDCILSRRRIPLAARIILYPVILIATSLIGLILPVFNIPSLLLFTGVTDGLADFRRLRKGESKDEEK